MSFFGDFIRSRRNERGLSLMDAAAKLKIGPPYLSRVERNLERPTNDLIRGIAKLLEIREDEVSAAARHLPPHMQGPRRPMMRPFGRMIR